MGMVKITKIHSKGKVITDEESPGTYVVPYVVDLACGCKKQKVEILHPDRDFKRGNEQEEMRIDPQKAQCPQGHSSIINRGKAKFIVRELFPG